MSAATWMLTVAMFINILVLIAVTGALIKGAHRIQVVYGHRTPGRDILLCIYLAILLMCVVLVVCMHVPASPLLRQGAHWAAASLMSVQIVYKLLTAAIVKGGKPPNLPLNPVVAANVAIAVYHSIALGVFLFSI